MQSPSPLSTDARTAFSRRFHVEVLRGGMNRLLLRAMPTKDEPTRVEILFQYVQHLNIPMKFDGLAVADVTKGNSEKTLYPELLKEFPECRVFRLESGGAFAGHIVAAACVYGEDSAPIGAESMFPMMS
jgi:hypothetical protein